MKAINIEWDISAEDLHDIYGDEVDVNEIDLDLPTEIEIPDCLAEADIEEISDYITEETGFFHNGFDLIKE